MVREAPDPRADGTPANSRGWQLARVKAVRSETPTVKSFGLQPETWRKFRAGQHIDVRLTAPDGYQAQRSYSIASAPERIGVLEITIELLDDGEVSPYFHEVVQPGDEIEFRGPIGGPFTWHKSISGALLLVAGGSGVVPLMSMLRHRESAQATDIPALLLYSARTDEDIIYREKLQQMESAESNLTVWFTLTRNTPPEWQGYSRRVDAAMIRDALENLAAGHDASHARTRCYICGPTDFVENVAKLTVADGIPEADIRTERFGPTGT